MTWDDMKVEVNVKKSIGRIGFVNFPRFGFALCDLAEDTIVHGGSLLFGICWAVCLL
jgi:hypothetical protein